MPNLENVVCSTGFCVLRSKDLSLSQKFLSYIVKSESFIHSVIKESYGVSYPAITSSDLISIKVPLPPLSEQKKISNYLDRKIQQIDQLIEKTQKKVELLKEQRTSLINHHVTKGLDQNVKMKDSGIEIIGKTPEHWNIRRLATLGFFSKGKNVTKSDLVENGEPVILYSHIYTTYSRVTNLTKFFISREKSLETTKVSKGMFLLTSSGESAEDIGKLFTMVKIEISVGGDMVILSLKLIKIFDYESFIFF